MTTGRKLELLNYAYEDARRLPDEIRSVLQRVKEGRLPVDSIDAEFDVIQGHVEALSEDLSHIRDALYSE